MACIALVAHRAGRTELQGDGVVPVSQLSFTKAEEAHFKGAKKMGDVEARSAMNRYYDTLGEEQQVEHKAALKRSFNKIEGEQSLSQWFNKMGKKYLMQTEAEKAARKASHPGQIRFHRQMKYEAPQKDEASAQEPEAPQKDEASAQEPVAAAEDPDAVPMVKKESVEDRMIATVAAYQQQQKHFAEMRKAAEEEAEQEQKQAVKAYNAKLEAKKEAAHELEEAAEAEQKRAVAAWKASQEAKAETAKKTVEKREKVCVCVCVCACVNMYVYVNVCV